MSSCCVCQLLLLFVAVGNVMCSALCCAFVTLLGRQGMFGYVHSEGILVTQKKEFHVKAAPGFRVNYVYSRITTFRREVLRVRQVTSAWCPWPQRMWLPTWGVLSNCWVTIRTRTDQDNNGHVELSLPVTFCLKKHGSALKSHTKLLTNWLKLLILI
jgi:hypothetical protein